MVSPPVRTKHPPPSLPPLLLGAFGSVYKVLLRGHTVCAAKLLEWQDRQHLQALFVQEAGMLCRLRCVGWGWGWGVGVGGGGGRGTLLLRRRVGAAELAATAGARWAPPAVWLAPAVPGLDPGPTPSQAPQCGDFHGNFAQR